MKQKFIPLDMSVLPEYMYTRAEVLKVAREVTKELWVKDISLEDCNKISFRTNDINIIEIMNWFVQFSYKLDNVADINLESAYNINGIWVIIFFHNNKLFPPRKRGKQKIGRLEGYIW